MREREREREQRARESPYESSVRTYYVRESKRGNKDGDESGVMSGERVW